MQVTISPEQIKRLLISSHQSYKRLSDKFDSIGLCTEGMDADPDEGILDIVMDMLIPVEDERLCELSQEHLEYSLAIGDPIPTIRENYRSCIHECLWDDAHDEMMHFIEEAYEYGKAQV